MPLFLQFLGPSGVHATSGVYLGRPLFLVILFPTLTAITKILEGVVIGSRDLG